MDIVDKLEDDARSIRRFGEERHGFVDYGLMAANAREAAAEITRLRAEVERLTAALEEIARLGNTTGYGRAALATRARAALAADGKQE